MINLLSQLYLTYALTLGYTPIDQTTLFNVDSLYETYIDMPRFYTLFDCDVNIGKFYVGGNVRTSIMMNSIDAYVPLQDSYTFRIGYNVDLSKVDVNIGFNHTCTHMVATMLQELPSHRDIVVEEIFIKISNK